MMRTIRTQSRFGWLAALAVFGLIGASSLKAAEPLPELNQKVYDFAREQLGKKVGNGSCSTLAMVALRQCGARPYPFDASTGEFAWGIEVKSSKEALPGDIIQFRNVVFKGRKFLGGGRSLSWMNTYPTHTAIVAGVSKEGRLVAILHQNVGAEDADDSVKKIVQEGTLQMEALQPGGTMHFYRPVPARSGLPNREDLRRVFFEGGFPQSFGTEWSWVQEDAVKWRVEKGVLVLRPPTVAGEKKGGEAQSLLLHALPRTRDDLYHVEITLESRPVDPQERAGLVCYRDDEHIVGVVKQLHKGKPVVRLIGDTDSDPPLPFSKLDPKAAPVQLRLMVWSGIVTGQFRTSSDEAWQTVGRCPIPAREDLRVGVLAAPGPRKSANEVRFRELRIVRQSNAREHN